MNIKDECPMCGKEKSQRAKFCMSCRNTLKDNGEFDQGPRYIPSPEEIRERCEEIREEWPENRLNPPIDPLTLDKPIKSVRSPFEINPTGTYTLY